MTFVLREYKCDCGKLLYKGLSGTLVVRVKCKQCGKVVSFGVSFSSESCLLLNDMEEHEDLKKSLKDGILYKIEHNTFLLRDKSKTFKIKKIRR